jgi:hypothetical protein
MFVSMPPLVHGVGDVCQISKDGSLVTFVNHSLASFRCHHLTGPK